MINNRLCIGTFFFACLMFSSDCFGFKSSEGFLPGTIVKTLAGEQYIEKIIPEEKVLVYNFNRHRFVGRAVYKTRVTSHLDRLTFLLVNDEFLCLCPEHRLYSLTRQGWVEAQALQADEELLNNSGKPVIVYARGEITNITTPVYNLSIKGKHNYLVSSYGVVVHNDFGLVLTVSYVFGSGVGMSIGAFGGIAALVWLYEQCVGHKAALDTSAVGNACVRMNIMSHVVPFKNNLHENTQDMLPKSFSVKQQSPIANKNPYANPLDALSKTLKESYSKNYNQPGLNLNFVERTLFSALPNHVQDDGLLITPLPPPIDQIPGGGPSPIEGLLNKPQILINVPLQLEQQGLHVFPIVDESFCPRLEGILIPSLDWRDNINAMGKENFQYLEDILKGAKRGKKTEGPSTIFEKPGGYEDALKDFESLGLSDIKSLSRGTIGKVGLLPDGRHVVVRTESRDKRPTLEVQERDSPDKIKIRYGVRT